MKHIFECLNGVPHTIWFDNEFVAPEIQTQMKHEFVKYRSQLKSSKKIIILNHIHLLINMGLLIKYHLTILKDI